MYKAGILLCAVLYAAGPAAAQGAGQNEPAQLEPQRTTATFMDWVVQCESLTKPQYQKVCDMAQVTQVQGKNIPFSRVALAQQKKGQPIRLIVQVPVNASFGSTVRIRTSDADPGIAAPFARCVPSGCFAEFDLREDMVKKFRAATGTGKLSFADSGGHEVVVPLSFNGFNQAYEALLKE
jgi:invasion protein IalB